MLALAGLDLLLGGRLSMFFDLAFISLCLGQAALVRDDHSFAASFGPPVQMIAAFIVLAVIDPTVLGQSHDSVVQSVIAGLTGHATALAIGYALFLVALWSGQSGRGMSPDTVTS